ncbi:MAG: argininosuccinate lyase [Bacteroidales bacterium]
MKLWDKGLTSDGRVDDFTAGRDRILDRRLLVWDIAGTMAHAVMLYESGIISREEKVILLEALHSIFQKAEAGLTEWDPEFEDVHSMVEAELVSITGESGKKIHAGRSRNDQVLVDISLWLRHEIALIADDAFGLLEKIASLGRRYSGTMMPGHTHLQPAMPSTFGLWFGSYAESLGEDLLALSGAWSAVNVSPAGTAAGYGTSLPLKREVVASLLKFERMVVSSPYAQMRRGKMAKIVADAIASTAFSLNRLSGDICLFLSGEFSFLGLSDSFSTGSSIMPQKKNPDVFEIIRARTNLLLSLPGTIIMMTTNLPPGYNRDYQVIKEVLFPAADEIRSLISMTGYMLDGLRVRDNIMEGRYNEVYATEEANRLVLKGVPFRDAYRKVAGEVGTRSFRATTPADYTHLGSIGNPGIDEILEFAGKVAGTIALIPASEIVSGIMD